MPIYDYYCEQCHQKFEVSKSIDKRHTARCPRCNSKGRLMFTPIPHYWKDGVPN